MKKSVWRVVFILIVLVMLAALCGCAPVQPAPAAALEEPELLAPVEADEAPAELTAEQRAERYAAIPSAPPADGYTLIRGATILTGSGDEYPEGDILVRGGVIEYAGSRVAAPDDAVVIDAAGLWATPGLIDARSHTGLERVKCETTPAMRALDGIDPISEGFSEARRGGVTCICTGPEDNSAFGCAWALVKTAGRAADDMLVSDCAGLSANLCGEDASLMERAAILRRALSDAADYQRQRAAGLAGKELSLEAVSSVLSGGCPLKARVCTADEILTVIRIAKEFDIGVTLDCPEDAALISRKIYQSSFGALLRPAEGEAAKTPALLEKEGVRFALVTDAPNSPQSSLLTWARLAVKNGLSEEAALAGVTSSPAALLGWDGSLGTLEAGKDADIVLFDAPPMQEGANVKRVFIDGALVYQD